MRRMLTALLIAAVLLTIFSPLAKADEVQEFIKLNEPKDNLMTSSSKVLLAGETVPNASIEVLVNGRQEVRTLSVGAAGIFMTQVPISSKENIITVKASFPSGGRETVTRKVFLMESESKLPELTSLIQTLKSFLIFNKRRCCHCQGILSWMDSYCAGSHQPFLSFTIWSQVPGNFSAFKMGQEDKKVEPIYTVSPEKILVYFGNSFSTLLKPSSPLYDETWSIARELLKTRSNASPEL